MKITSKLATSKTPDGGLMELFQHDNNFFININGDTLMDSRAYESELALARLGCLHLINEEKPKVLIGGLGLGYTLRQCLDMVGPNASVIVCELMDAVIEWNNKYIGALADYPLSDKRTIIQCGDIVEYLTNTHEQFDAILLDIDNGPVAMTDSGNSRLYDWDGIFMCQGALKKRGCLAVWSSDSSGRYERDLLKADFSVKRYLSPSHKNTKSCKHVIWVASEDKSLLPPDGKAPIPKKHKKNRKRNKKWNNPF